jgi:ArsR family transcriptional regulator
MQTHEDSLSMTQTVHVMKALAHHSRLTIVQALSAGELCVGDLQHLVGSDMSTVSKHLTVLKSAGIVDDRKAGLQVFYRLRIPCLADFVNCIASVMAGNAPHLPEGIFLGMSEDGNGHANRG